MNTEAKIKYLESKRKNIIIQLGWDKEKLDVCKQAVLGYEYDIATIDSQIGALKNSLALETPLELNPGHAIVTFGKHPLENIKAQKHLERGHALVMEGNYIQDRMHIVLKPGVKLWVYHDQKEFDDNFHLALYNRSDRLLVCPSKSSLSDLSSTPVVDSS